MIIVAILAAAWWCGAVGFLAVTLCGTLLRPRMERRRGTRSDQPPVSLIVPVKQLDQGFERAQTSVFTQDYPDYEVLVAAAEAASPALAAMQAMRARQTRCRVRFERSEATAAASPKLNVLGPSIAAAAHDLILTKDSNISLDPDGLARFVRALTPDVGLVVGVPLAVRPKGLAGHIEAFLINGHARVLLTAAACGLGMGIGKVMLFRQGDLRRLGGVAALSHTIAEDHALAAALAKLGLKTRFAAGTVDQETGARSLREVFYRQVRWSVIRRCQEPVTYLFEPVISPLVAAVAAALAAPLTALPGWFAFLATLSGWFAGEIGVSALKGWEVSVWSVPAFLGREILSLAAWMRAWVRQDVVWASGRYDLATEVGRGVKPKS